MTNIHTLAPHLQANGRMKEVQMAALDWIYRFGSTTRAFITHDLFSPQESQDLDRTLFTQGWVRSVPCGASLDAKGIPEGLLVLTEKGLALAQEHYARAFPYPELDWEVCKDVQINERIWTQKLTAANYREGGMNRFWTRRMMSLDGENYPFPDMEWSMQDGRLLAITVDNGDFFPDRHRFCVALCERTQLGHRYDREIIIADDYGIIEDYHRRLKPGSLLPVWDEDTADFVPIEQVVVPDLHRRMVVFLADPWGEVLVS